MHSTTADQTQLGIFHNIYADPNHEVLQQLEEEDSTLLDHAEEKFDHNKLEEAI